MKPFLLLALCMVSGLLACTQTSTWKGKLVYAYVEDISSYSFADKKDRILFTKADQPYVAANGDIFFRNLKFPKVKELVR